MQKCSYKKGKQHNINDGFVLFLMFITHCIKDRQFIYIICIISKHFSFKTALSHATENTNQIKGLQKNKKYYDTIFKKYYFLQ